MGGKNPLRERRTLKYPAGVVQPKDWLRFVQLDLFEKCWGALGLEDEDLRGLEMLIMLNPDGPPVMKGTGGVRKLRFAGQHWSKGKRGGARIYYLYVPDRGLIFLLFAHMKNEQETISEDGKAHMRSLVKEILDCLENGI